MILAKKTLQTVLENQVLYQQLHHVRLYNIWND